MDPGGFYTGGDRLHDMQSQSTIFLLKIVLTKEAKESFLLFDDVFHFFCLQFCADKVNDFNWK